MGGSEWIEEGDLGNDQYLDADGVLIDADGNPIDDDGMDHKIISRNGGGSASWPVKHEVAADKAAALDALVAEHSSEEDEGTGTEVTGVVDDGNHADY